MKILLIVPPILYARQPPIGIAYLTSYLRNNGYDVKAWDLNTDVFIQNDGDDTFWSYKKNCEEFYYGNKELFESWTKKILDYDPQIIGFTIWSTTLYFSLKLALQIKKRDKKKLIVYGGYKCNIGVYEIFDYPQVDIVVKGEGENTLLDIVKQYTDRGKIEFCNGSVVRCDGQITDCGIRPEIEDLNGISFPDFSDFKMDKYLYKFHIPIVFSRGCSWRCSFCTLFRTWNRLRIRSAENIYQEITLRMRQYPNLKRFEICDAAFNQDISVISKLSDLIITNGIKVEFSGLAQIRPEMDYKFLKKMRKAGFCLFNYGLESGSQKVLDSMGKKFNIKDAERVIKDCYEAGIEQVFNFIVGYPTETENDFYETLKFIEKIKNYTSNIAPAHECDIAFSNLQSNHTKFNIVIPQIEDGVRFWRTMDNKNTPAERKRRREIFDKFTSDLGIPLKCGKEDREDIMNSNLRPLKNPICNFFHSPSGK